MSKVIHACLKNILQVIQPCKMFVRSVPAVVGPANVKAVGVVDMSLIHSCVRLKIDKFKDCQHHACYWSRHVINIDIAFFCLA